MAGSAPRPDGRVPAGPSGGARTSAATGRPTWLGSRQCFPHRPRRVVRGGGVPGRGRKQRGRSPATGHRAAATAETCRRLVGPGDLRARQARWAEAESLLTEAASLAHPMPYPFGEARSLYEWGRILAGQGKAERARERLEQALAIFTRLGARRHIERTKQALDVLAPGRRRLGQIVIGITASQVPRAVPGLRVSSPRVGGRGRQHRPHERALEPARRPRDPALQPHPDTERPRRRP